MRPNDNNSNRHLYHAVSRNFRNGGSTGDETGECRTYIDVNSDINGPSTFTV